MTTQTERTAWEPLREALAALAGVCDGAEERDHRGFSSADVPDGHYLAALPTDKWTDREARVAHQLACVYRRQLDGFGIDVEALPLPPSAEAPAHAGTGERGERGQVATARKAAARRERMIKSARCDVMISGLTRGPRLFLVLHPDLGLTDEACKIAGYLHADRWGTHNYAVSAAHELIAFCDRHGIAVGENVRDIEGFVARHNAREAARLAERRERFGPNLLRDTDGGLILKFDGRPSGHVLSTVKRAIPGLRWNDLARLWTLPHSSLTQAVAAATALKLRIADELVEQAQAEARRRAENRAASIALAPAGPPPEIPGLAGQLKPHQAAALEFIVANRRVLLGDKMGLGKTLTALAALVHTGAWPAVVVCKTSLRETWRAEIERFFPDLAVFAATGTAAGTVPAGTDIVVIGFDVLRETATVTRDAAKHKVPGWLPALTALAPQALIVDESQFGKEADALRSRAMETLAQAVPPHGLVLCLTGTAIVNRPRELIQQLKILGRLDDLGGERTFLFRYCDPDFTEHGAVFNGASNLDELHLLLRETGVYLRRGDEALNLPRLTIRPQHLTPQELEPAAMAAYRRAEDDFLTEWIALAKRRGVKLSNPAALFEFCARAMNAKLLVRLNLLRQLVGAAKRAAVTAHVAALVAQREKVMIAAHHRDAVAAYTATFGRLRIQGGQTPESIEADKAAFQSRSVDDAPVITVSIQAGGVGHTLTAAAHGVMAELPWTWAEIEQMAARLHRIGQTRAVDFPVVIAPGTVDEQMWQTLAHKREITHAVLDAPDAHPAPSEQAGEDERNAAAQVMALMMAGRATRRPARRRASSPG